MLTLLLTTLATALAAPPPAHPAVIARAAVGLPTLVGGQIEIFVADAWAVEVGGGVGLLPSTVTLGTRWSPEATCWGCWDGHGLRLSPGLTWYALPSNMSEGLVTLNADLAWVYRPAQGPGVMAGIRGGLGLAYGNINGRFKPEPGMELYPLIAGVVF